MPSPRRAEIVVGCRELQETRRFFVEELGFRLDMVFPADDPSVMVVSGHGVRLRLERDGTAGPVVLRLSCDDPAAVAGGRMELRAPNGMVVRLAAFPEPLVVPPNRPSFVLTRIDEGGSWVVGRAEMRYRDLLPGRHGGRFIASHIRIPTGGEVPDYVHFHEVRFQMIYCYRGWVRVVYEEQGPPFVLQPGDCVLQPPKIRHRVLECSAGMEVIEIGCPAKHPTHSDHELALPTATLDAGREFDGQRFVRHVAAEAEWRPWRGDGFEARDAGFGPATAGLVGARVVRPGGARGGRPQSPPRVSHAELLLRFVLQGSCTLRHGDGDAERLAAGDCVALPAGMPHRIESCSPDLEFLEVSSPADPDAP